MRVIIHRSYINTVRESALKVDWKKNPFPHLGGGGEGGVQTCISILPGYVVPGFSIQHSAIWAIQPLWSCPQTSGRPGVTGVAGDRRWGRRQAGAADQSGQRNHPLPHEPQCWGWGLRPHDGDWASGPGHGVCGRAGLSPRLLVSDKVGVCLVCGIVCVCVCAEGCVCVCVSEWEKVNKLVSMCCVFICACVCEHAIGYAQIRFVFKKNISYRRGIVFL